MIDELLKRLPVALYSGGLYMQYDMCGLWYCGYHNSTYQISDRDLKKALTTLVNVLNENGYGI